MQSTRLIICVLAVLAAHAAGFAKELTYIDLVKRLTDLEQVAVLPEPGETCTQWSSYDRASKYDEATGKYVKWDANGDGGGIIRTEGDKLVVAEMQGPGVIWRIWSARPQQGHMRIYLDGAAEPAVDLPFIGYFDGKNAPFAGKALVHTVARGWNCYVPIPYQKSCKIVADKGWGQYYQFTFTTFPKDTKVPTFRMDLAKDEMAALQEADRTLANATAAAGKRDGQATVNGKIVVEPGKTVKLAAIDGARAITSLRMKLALPASPADRDVLRELALKMTWDGEAEPAVWTPVGDFFGTAAGANAYGSLPMGLDGQGTWYSHWYMPFAKGAVIEIVNDGKEPRELSFEIDHAPLTKPIETLGRFHAKWHRDVYLPAEPERKIDWTMLTTTGRGRFAGVMLHVWNPRGGWWGEGDEKFFVDGEKFPSTIGTGSEDYFGYAWCDPTLFQNAYHNQTISMGNKGHVSVNRWHVADNVPFQKSFEAAIEKYFPNTRPTLYAATVYWYLAPGGKDPYPAVPVDQRVGYWTATAANRVPGAIEGEQLKVLGKTGGKTQEQFLNHFEGKWSSEAQLWWTTAKAGDKLELELPVEKAGKYRLLAQFTKAKDYGIAQLSLDGQKLGQPIDFYSPNVVPSGAMDLGELDLPAGPHKLTIEITGANEKAVKAFMVGIDYVKLEPGK